MKFLDLRDRFARGLVAGVVASVCQAMLNLFAYYVLHVPGGRYYNFAASLILGKKASTLAEAIFCQIVQTGFAIGMAVLFAYIILGINSRNHELKGMLWGLAVWFMSYSVVILFKVNTGLKINIYSATSTAVVGMIWGLILTLMLRWLDNRVSETGENGINQPNRKISFTPTPAMKKKSNR